MFALPAKTVPMKKDQPREALLRLDVSVWTDTTKLTASFVKLATLFASLAREAAIFVLHVMRMLTLNSKAPLVCARQVPICFKLILQLHVSPATRSALLVKLAPFSVLVVLVLISEN